MVRSFTIINTNDAGGDVLISTLITLFKAKYTTVALAMMCL